jgi:hypothetical protein
VSEGNGQNQDSGLGLTAADPSKSFRYMQIDEDGYFKIDGLRVADVEIGRDWLSRLNLDYRGRITLQTNPVLLNDTLNSNVPEINHETTLVECFDEPFIALDIERVASNSIPEGTSLDKWHVRLPYGHSESFSLHSLSVDDWDRFHGLTERGIPFVLSRSAQAHFFDLVDEFDDDSVTIGNETIAIGHWLETNPSVEDNRFWNNKYTQREDRWDLGGPAPVLDSIVPKLKLSPLRVLVPGAGRGHDAAWFARAGHIVTAVDFSAEAITRAKELYGHLPNITFIQSDILQLSTSMNESFDLIFEHTCYCAVSPTKRNQLIRTYRRLLAEQGHILGVFFTMEKRSGPPYGGSEWEVRARLNKNFRLLYWMRLHDSAPSRTGQELLVYAQKIPSLS